MCTEKYLWYVPKHNMVIQDKGVFTNAGVFEHEEAAIEYLSKKEELPAKKDEIVMLRTDCNPVGDAADLI